MAVLITAGQRPTSVAAPPPTVVASVPLLTQARLCHLTASRMIAALDAQLTRLDAIPIADWAEWHAGTIDYNHARYRFPDAQRPSWWPWRPSLREALYQSYGIAIQLRGKIMDQEKLWRRCWHSMTGPTRCAWTCTAIGSQRATARRRKSGTSVSRASDASPHADALLAVSALEAWRKALRGQ